MQIAMAQKAFMDETECGDGCGYWEVDGKMVLCMADGLGHGPQAAKAARAALDYARENAHLGLAELFAGCDRTIRHTRGVAMGMAILEPSRERLQYAAIGNTQAVLMGATHRRLTGNPGIVGAGYHKLQPLTEAFRPQDTVLLFTDGIAPQIKLAAYSTVVLQNPQTLAEQILADWSRPNDDAAILVCRFPALT